MARALAARGVHLERLDLNQPSFSRLTFSGALEVIERWAQAGPAEAPLALMGSSMGGYLCARWAQRHPGRVARMVLLCPGFDLQGRWPALIGADAMARWRASGWRDFEDAAGAPTPVHWGLIEDAATHSPAPAPSCPALIIHGAQDEVVPVESSRAYQAAHPAQVQLIEVEDDHALTRSMPLIERAALDFFGLGERA
jgi:pimeloyl-ACP methyl ester carboxylesterase